MKIGDLVKTVPSVWPGSESAGIILKLQYNIAWIYWSEHFPYERAYQDELVVIEK